MPRRLSVVLVCLAAPLAGTLGCDDAPDADADADVDGDLDADGSSDGDGDADVDADGDADVDGDVDADGDADGDADEDGDVEVVFPLAVSPSGHHLVDARGRPFLVHGDTPWSLIVQLTYDEAVDYLDDRRGRGFDTVLVNLIEHQFADDPPNNAAGEGPFLVPGDLSTPNDAYFDHAERVVEAAAERHMAMFLTPAYLGYGGGSEGWFVELGAMDLSGCRTYGEYLVARFADDENVLWVHGGDYAPPPGSAGEACALEILDALRDGDAGALHTMHWARHSSSVDEPAWVDAVDLNSVYTDELSYPRCLDAYALDPPVPAYLIEGRYEQEGRSPRVVRGQAYWAVLSCVGGQLMGNDPIWYFGDGWREALDSTLARDMTVLGELLAPRRWHDLVPDADRSLVAAGGGTLGGADWVSAASTVDGALAVAYLPSSRTITLDASRLAAGAEARGRGPPDGTSTIDDGPPIPDDGPHALSPPGPNAAGDDDWVLLVE